MYSIKSFGILLKFLLARLLIDPMNNQDFNKLGTLVLAANSIGPATDIPSRSLDAVRLSDLLVFEEPRKAREVLKSAGIHREFLLYSEHRQMETAAAIRSALLGGKTVLYMSDQGCPSLQDPGSEIAKIGHELGARIRVVPGPSSLTSAISACPFDCKSFYFAGFLPREQAEREKTLRALTSLGVPIILMDTPYRLQNVLESCEIVLGAGASAYLAADISSDDETYLAGSLKKIRNMTSNWPKQRNFVLILGSNTMKK